MQKRTLWVPGGFMDEEPPALQGLLARPYKYSTHTTMLRTRLDTLQGDVASKFWWYEVFDSQLHALRSCKTLLSSRTGCKTSGLRYDICPSCAHISISVVEILNVPTTGLTATTIVGDKGNSMPTNNPGDHTVLLRPR